jgi:hypothetical protein
MRQHARRVLGIGECLVHEPACFVIVSKDQHACLRVFNACLLCERPDCGSQLVVVFQEMHAKFKVVLPPHGCAGQRHFHRLATRDANFCCHRLRQIEDEGDLAAYGHFETATQPGAAAAEIGNRAHDIA